MNYGQISAGQTTTAAGAAPGGSVAVPHIEISAAALSGRLERILRSRSLLTAGQLEVCRELVASASQQGRLMSIGQAAIELGYLARAVEMQVASAARAELYFERSRAALAALVGAGLLTQDQSRQLQEEQQAAYQRDGKLLDVLDAAQKHGFASATTMKAALPNVPDTTPADAPVKPAFRIPALVMVILITGMFGCLMGMAAEWAALVFCVLCVAGASIVILMADRYSWRVTDATLSVNLPPWVRFVAFIDLCMLVMRINGAQWWWLVCLLPALVLLKVIYRGLVGRGRAFQPVVRAFNWLRVLPDGVRAYAAMREDQLRITTRDKFMADMQALVDKEKARLLDEEQRRQKAERERWDREEAARRARESADDQARRQREAAAYDRVEGERRRRTAEAWDTAEHRRQTEEADRRRREAADWDQAEARRRQNETDRRQRESAAWDQAEAQRRITETEAWNRKQEEGVRNAIATADARAMDEARQKIQSQLAALEQEARAKVHEMHEQTLREEQEARHAFRRDWLEAEKAKREQVSASWQEKLQGSQRAVELAMQDEVVSWQNLLRQQWLRAFGPDYPSWSAEWREHVAPKLCSACKKPFGRTTSAAYVCSRAGCGAAYHESCLKKHLKSNGRCAGRTGASAACDACKPDDFAQILKRRDTRSAYPELVTPATALITNSELQSRLDANGTGDVVSLAHPEFPLEVAGPLSVRRRLTFDGHNATIWALKGPVLRVEADEVVIRDLRIEVTSDPLPVNVLERCALWVKPGCKVHMVNVNVRGTLNGIEHEEGDWDYPASIPFGNLARGVNYQVGMPVTVPVACEVRSLVAGVMVEPIRLEPGRHELRVRLSAKGLAVGTVIHGDICLMTPAVARSIRVTANIVPSKP